MSSPVASNSESLTIDGLGTYLFVWNQPNISCKSCSSIPEFSIDSTGSLTPVNGSGRFPSIHDLSGNVIYADGDSLLIDADSGLLTQLATGAVPAGQDFIPLAIHPSGSFIYGKLLPGGVLSAGSISPTTGQVSLVAGSPFVSPFGNFNQVTFDQVTIDSSGKYAFAIGVDTIAPEILVTFAIDPTSGGLSLLNFATFPRPSGGGDLSRLGNVLAHPSHEFLYLTVQGDNAIFAGDVILAYSIAGDGNLTPIAGSPFPAGGVGLNPSLVTDAGGMFLYVGNQNGISGFMIDQTTGALTSIAGSPFPISSTALAIVK